MTADLLELAMADAIAAWDASERVLASDPDPCAKSFAHHARGIVLRDWGRVAEALAELRAGLASARRVDQSREADVRATYGTTLFLAGQTRVALRALDRAAAQATGELWAKVLMRRAWVLMVVGRYEAALADLGPALAGIRGSDRPWEARTLNNIGFVQLALGRAAEAEESFSEAERLFRDVGPAQEATHATANLGSAVLARGDLPRALEIYARVDPQSVSDGRLRLGLVTDKCEAFVAAGLIPEAVRTFEESLAAVDLPEGARSDMQYALAKLRLASDDAAAALPAAVQACEAFRRQGRDWFELRARLLLVRARHETGQRRGLAVAAREVARRLDEEGAAEAPAALILAARLTTGHERSALWRAGAAYRDHPGALVRATASLAAAFAYEEESNRRGVLGACGRGLDALDEHRRTLGSSELRALATSHGRGLAELAHRHAATDGRTLLRWSERWRATALAEPPAQGGDDVSPELAALRENGRRLAEARIDGDPTEQLEAERERLERAVRSEHHRRVGRGNDDRWFEVERLVADIGDGCLVEFVEVDGALHVLVVHGGQVRRRVAGPTVDALQLAANARSALRRAAHGRPYDPGDLGGRLQETLLGAAVDLLPDGPVVLSPTGRLHALPWSLLPTLADRPFSIVPSAAQWQRARAVPKPRRTKVLLLAAPGLGSGGSEVPKIARRHEGATVLRGKKATVDAAMAGLDGASLAHVAAHGHFRQDSPLFSSLEMADGPLSVYELERLKRAPYRLILSACESGVLAPVGADELLGLASALFSMGTAGLVCSIADVNDDATAALMVDLHEHLLAHPKEGLAGALLAARRAARGDPTREATAAAFLALGV